MWTAQHCTVSHIYLRKLCAQWNRRYGIGSLGHFVWTEHCFRITISIVIMGFYQFPGESKWCESKYLPSIGKWQSNYKSSICTTTDCSTTILWLHFENLFLVDIQLDFSMLGRKRQLILWMGNGTIGCSVLTVFQAFKYTF